MSPAKSKKPARAKAKPADDCCGIDTRAIAEHFATLGAEELDGIELNLSLCTDKAVAAEINKLLAKERASR